MKELEAADLEVLSDSSIGGESDNEVIGDTVPPNPSMPGQWRRRQTIRKISASKAGMRGALPKGTHTAASRSGSEEPGAEDAAQSSGDAAGPGADAL